MNTFVYNNLAGQTIEVIDQNNKTEQISFAKANERVQKEGSKNSHKVIEKLIRNNSNIKNLSVIQVEEVLRASKDIGNSEEHKHQWLDEKGWNYKKVYLQDINNNIYEATLNIAKTTDDRNLLYDINKIKKVDNAVVSSKRDSARISTFSEDSIPQNSKNVNDSNVQHSISNNISEDILSDIEEYKKGKKRMKEFLSSFILLNLFLICFLFVKSKMTNISILH